MLLKPGFFMTPECRKKTGLNQNQGAHGFTIVELLIVIVVIGILAAITLVSYTGINNNARTSALLSNLSQMAKEIEVNKLQNAGSYPSSLAAANINTPENGTYHYQRDGKTFCLSAMENGISYKVTNKSLTPVTGACSGVLSNGDICPSGFIVVPGNPTLGTSEFCVMKYEAKQASSTVPVSTATGAPWVSISHANAKAYSANVAGCTGCHLITEAEWMTIAANVLSVPSNWSSGSVGTGYIYNGHVNNYPASALEASTDDDEGLYGITDGTGDNTISNNRRTLTLTNGEVIWDLSGNVFEWTDQVQTVTGVGAAGDAGFAWREWSYASLLLGNLPVVSRPSTLATLPGLANITSWNSSNGIGILYANSSDNEPRAFLRGGGWNYTSRSGIMSLHLNIPASSVAGNFGFRVAR